MENKNDLHEIVKNEVMGLQYRARNDDDLAALKRLIEHPEARIAWSHLASKISGDEFRMAVSMIARDAANAHLEHRDKKSQTEINDAAKDAAKLAKQLARLIESNRSLQAFREEDILDQGELASMERIRGGLALLPRSNGKDWPCFGEGIENELDARQAERKPDLRDLTTSQAYRTVSGHWLPELFVLHLQNFAAFARESKKARPIRAQPKSKNAALQSFGLGVGSALNHFCGSPNDDIAARLVSAVFNTDVDSGLVKKWRQRQGDKT